MASDDRFAALTYDDFRRLADDPSLSKYEKIGFPNSYREGVEGEIFKDIQAKLSNLALRGKKVLDIGPGCSDLPKMLIELCRCNDHKLTLVDNQEMLNHLPNHAGIEKIPAHYPHCPEFLQSNQSKFDVILCYSVLHYIFVDNQIFGFLDSSLSLLAPGGQMLIGDIPNVSKRKRFFASEAGADFHRQFMNTELPPIVEFNRIEQGCIDDSVIMAIITRARAQGFDAYMLPQPANLPMSNRREDILLVRP
jgi:2-polyprenyl-3-methyl-5-hydroxy-6-metoxy-1,4-benzoquinol methylase